MKPRVPSGFTLLEVLITVVIFSIGLLGLAGLQVKGLTLAQDSLLRTTATLLANDMADRMRANMRAAQMGVSSPYNNPTGLEAGNPSCMGKDNVGQPVDTRCTPLEMASHDFYEWHGLLKGLKATNWHAAMNAQLPSSNGIVCIDSTPNDGTPTNPQCDNVSVNSNLSIFTIKIWWQERKLNQSNQYTVHSYITSIAL
ncbi:MAG: type IV pilus modification protein PilV [Gammaproteobacteria bacterium]